MSVAPLILQLDKVRLVVFNKSAHTSLANAMATNRGFPVVRSAGSSKGAKAGVFRDNTDRLDPEWAAANKPVITGAFVRHPLARCVSAWNHLIMQEKYQTFLDLGFEENMKFEPFCEQLLSMDDDTMDIHLQTQTRQMERVPDVGLTWIGQVDQLGDHWRQFVHFTALPCADTVPLLNGPKQTVPWTTHYTAALAHKMLAERYWRDLMFWRDRRWPV